ncbi:MULTISPECIES: Tn3 family transposase [Asaia]|uniref:Mobile element protein n=1 Tax=Asaia bogorensis TaxID=91915 RepID=A0A060QLN2_9PROT|nr:MULTISPECIES: Tn3 family transposase [Asaia]ETC99240.1 transposase TnpA [Asaia sp. SF2.1]CDG40482.1 Mobile element protein [Asaia bogorensis]
MPRRHILSARQRAALLDLPVDEVALLQHYILANDDLIHVNQRRRPENRIGFALQLCALRYPGRSLAPGELIPQAISTFLGAQLGIAGDTLVRYAVRRQTRQQHMEALRRIYGYGTFPSQGARAQAFRDWLSVEAEQARSNEDLARRFIARCRATMTILPAISTIERLCADALVAAERRMEKKIAQQLDPAACSRLDDLTTEILPGGITRFIWLRRIEPGNNSAAANRLLDRLEFLRAVNLDTRLLAGVAPHRVARLRRQGERYFADGLRDINAERRRAILAVCIIEWGTATADAIIETHDRIVSRTWREAKQLHDARIADARTSVAETLGGFTTLGRSLLAAYGDGASLEEAVADSAGWEQLTRLVATGMQLTDTLGDDPLAHVDQGYHRFRRYAPRMLRCLTLEAAPVGRPLLDAAIAIAIKGAISAGDAFLRPHSKWRRHLRVKSDDDARLREVAVMFHLRDALRAGDIWIERSHRYGDLREVLVPMPVALATTLAVSPDPHVWLAERKARLADGLVRLGRAARKGTIPQGVIEDGVLRIDRLTADVPDGVEALMLDLYRRMPPVRITDLLLEVDTALGFTEHFTHLRTGVPCDDRIGLLNVLLAEGLNLGLRKMAEASNTHDYWELSRLARWHVESEAMNQALAAVVAAQGELPMAQVWGMGTTASADGQFFLAARQGEAMNTINARYGNDPGIKVYTHVNDRFAPFASRTIPVTVNEAPYLLDGLTMNEAGRRIEEQYADTGGFTDHLFGISAMLGYRLVLRIRDLPSKKLYVFDSAATPRDLRPLVGGKVREALIVANWPDLFRCAATMSAGQVAPSRILRKLAAYPRQNDLAAALREVGRIERTLFIIEWLLDAGMQRRAQVGLNKGEAHHALKNALRIGRQGEIRDRTTEGQHYRISGLNLITAIIIYWNTLHLGHAVEARRREGLDTPDHLLAHVSPLGWAHILLTGEYLWPKDANA